MSAMIITKLFSVIMQNISEVMSETVHISRNGDGSLRHRVDEYLATLEAYNNVQYSKKFMNDPEWSDTLGHKEDIERAEKVLEQSLSHFTSLIDAQDLKLALTRGFLTEDQAKEFSQAKVQMEFGQLSTKSSQAQTDSLKHKL